MATSSNMLSSLARNIFNDPEYSDCEVHVEGQVFKVSKLILKLHSEVFRACFRHNSTESQENVIKIEDASAEIVELMLRFMHSETINNLDSKAFELFKLADRYNVLTLRTICAQSMCQNLQIDTIFNCLRVAYQVNDQELKTQCIKFVADNIQQIMEKDEWAELTGQEPLIYPDLLQLINGRLIELRQSQENDVALEEDDPIMTDIRSTRNELQQRIRQFVVANPPGNDPQASDNSLTAILLRDQAEIEDHARKIQYRTKFLNETIREYASLNRQLIQQLADGQISTNFSQIIETTQLIHRTVDRTQDLLATTLLGLNDALPTTHRGTNRRRRYPFRASPPPVRRRPLNFPLPALFDPAPLVNANIPPPALVDPAPLVNARARNADDENRRNVEFLLGDIQYF